MIGALRHPLPFDEIVAAVAPRRTLRPPLCQAIFLFQSTLEAQLRFGACEVEALPPRPSGGMFEMTLELWPTNDGSFIGSLHYQPASVDHGLAKAVHADWLARLMGYISLA
jgi:hypothetical protein